MKTTQTISTHSTRAPGAGADDGKEEATKNEGGALALLSGNLQPANRAGGGKIEDAKQEDISQKEDHVDLSLAAKRHLMENIGQPGSQKQPLIEERLGMRLKVAALQHYFKTGEHIKF